ncbi:MAG: hypothetical protein F4056_05145 [Chloroflexi bacterium]|nr:hypothetical protein [Chloroflexota bacterium]MYI82706.1 hypothetical protein [Chloroflexota bacterium]
MSEDGETGIDGEESQQKKGFPLGLLRAVIGGIAIIALFVQWTNAQGVLESARSPSAVQVIQLQVDYFIAPAILTIGITMAAYIATRWE